MKDNKIAMGSLTYMAKQMLEEAGIKTSLMSNCSFLHKVYKDAVFNETMFYHDYKTFGVNLLKEPYIAVSLHRDIDKLDRYAMFCLDSVAVYPKDLDQAKKTVVQLSEQYKKCHEAYLMMKEDIDRANKSIEETSKKVEFRELNKYVKQVERQLNSQLQDLMKIAEMT